MNTTENTEYEAPFFLSKSLASAENLRHFNQDVMGVPGRPSQFARIMESMHELAVDDEDALAVIFFAGIKSLPYATVAKYFWQQAYPETPRPPFALIDASIKKYGEGSLPGVTTKAIDEQNDRLAKIGKRHGHTNVAVFDEIVITQNSLMKAMGILRGNGFENIHPFGLRIFSDGLHTSSVENPIWRERTKEMYGWKRNPLQDKAWPLLADMKKVGTIAAVNTMRPAHPLYGAT